MKISKSLNFKKSNFLRQVPSLIKSTVYIQATLLVAHHALPVTSILAHRNVRVEDKCRLCGQDGETMVHLFITCTMVRDLKRKMESEMNWLQGRTLGEEEILYHEGTVKMRKKDSEKIGLFKHSIWIVRGLRYYGQIQNDEEVKTKLRHLYSSKTNQIGA